MYLDQIEKLVDVLFFLIEQLSEKDIELLRNKNFLSRLSSKLELFDNYTEGPEDEEGELNLENDLDIDDLEEDHNDELENKDGLFDFNKDFKASALPAQSKSRRGPKGLKRTPRRYG